MNPKIIAIIQARCGSTRLPQKVIADINGKTLLENVVDRVRSSSSINKIIIATTKSNDDDVIVNLGREKNWNIHRGIEGQVIEQFYDIAKIENADAVVRITADCALIDAELIDKVINKFLTYYPDIDYGSNILPRSYPRGLDVEVVSFRILEKEWRESTRWRNHVTLNLRKNYWRYKTCNITNDSNYSYMRWVVDYPKDLEFVRKVYNNFKEGVFDWIDVLKLLRLHPEWIIMDTQKDPD
jgi:spore coat polysaccharide biosynthesis protein SpsF (cytidylyltransferase family)